MVELIPVLDLSGPRYSPREVEITTGLVLSRKAEPGDIGTHGKYRGQPIPFGWATVEVPASIEPSRRLAWLLETVTPHAETFRRLGGELWRLHVDVRYWDQCNLEFSQDEVASIAALKVAFTITCWDRTGDGSEPA